VTRVSATVTAPGAEVARVASLLDELARVHRLDAHAVADMQVALDEVLSNILRHGFVGETAHRVEIVLAVDGDRLTAELEDDCAPFDPLGVPPPDTRSSLADRRVGGLGVHFVRSLMSTVSYARVGTRNRLVLVKSLIGEGATRGSR